MFSKPKEAHLKNRSISQLELLGAIVGLQALINILEVYKHADIGSVYLALYHNQLCNMVFSYLIIHKPGRLSSLGNRSQKLNRRPLTQT